MTLFFLIDTSGSMEGNKIGAVNDAVANVLPMLDEISAENPDAEIKVAALEFSSGVNWLYSEPKACLRLRLAGCQGWRTYIAWSSVCRAFHQTFA